MTLISKAHNFFIPVEKEQDEYLVYRHKLILNASVSTSFFSFVYLLVSIFIEFWPGVYLMVFNVVGFALIPFLVRGKTPHIILGNVYVLIGSVAVLILIFFSGGLKSPIFPWLIAPPVLALLIVNRFYAMVWTGISIICLTVLTIITKNGFSFPEMYNTSWSLYFSYLCSSGIILIIIMIAMIFEGNIKEALTTLTEKNTEISEKNEELIMISEQLKKLDEKKNDLMYLIAHDLKSPLSNMQALIWLTKLKQEKDRMSQAEAITIIADQIKKMQALIQRILNSENFENIAYNLKLEEINLVLLTDGVVKDLKNLAENKSIELLFFQNEEELITLTDKIYLTQIVENLINNALKFSPKGKQVIVSATSHENNVRISIKDEGPGIKEEEMENLFRKNANISNRPTAGETSSGIGLSIVKQYSELLNGRVWCESKYGHGSNFIAEFPKYQKTSN